MTYKYTIDRIASLLTHCELPSLPNMDWKELGMPRSDRPYLHEVLNVIDTQMNVDTTFVSPLVWHNRHGHRLPGCNCLQTLGTCSHRRQVGARVALLEECMARNLSG